MDAPATLGVPRSADFQIFSQRALMFLRGAMDQNRPTLRPRQIPACASALIERDALVLPPKPQLSSGRRDIHREHKSLAVTPNVVQVPVERPRQPE